MEQAAERREKFRLVVTFRHSTGAVRNACRRHRRVTGFTLQARPRPAPIPIQLLRFDRRFSQEVRERHRRYHRLQFSEEALETGADRLLEIVKDDPARFAIELDRAARGKVRKSASNLFFNLAARSSG